MVLFLCVVLFAVSMTLLFSVRRASKREQIHRDVMLSEYEYSKRLRNEVSRLRSELLAKKVSDTIHSRSN